MTLLRESGKERFTRLIEVNKDPQIRQKTLEAEFAALEASGVVPVLTEIRRSLDEAKKATKLFFEVVTQEPEEIDFYPSQWRSLADTFEVTASDIVLPVINLDLAYSKGPKQSNEGTLSTNGQYSRLLRVTADPVGILFMHHTFSRPHDFQRPQNDVNFRESAMDWQGRNNVGDRLKQFYQERFSPLQGV